VNDYWQLGAAAEYFTGPLDEARPTGETAFDRLALGIPAITIPPGCQSHDQAVANSTVFTDSLFMHWDVEAGGQYIYEALIIADSRPPARFRYRVALPVGTVMTSDAPGADVVNTDDATEFIIRPGADTPHRGRGLIDVGTHSGRVRVQFTQAKPNNSPTILKEGSWIRLTLITEHLVAASPGARGAESVAVDPGSPTRAGEPDSPAAGDTGPRITSEHLR
jgi:hypothetical protein